MRGALRRDVAPEGLCRASGNISTVDISCMPTLIHPHSLVAHLEKLHPVILTFLSYLLELSEGQENLARTGVISDTELSPASPGWAHL